MISWGDNSALRDRRHSAPLPAPTLFAALLALALIGGDARAQSSDSLPLPYLRFEEGAYPFDEDERDYWSVRRAAGVRPLRQLGPDSFRFTFDASSALRSSYVFEARRRRDDATLDVVWLDRRQGWSGWRPARRLRVRIALSEYDSLAAQIDDELRRGHAYAARLDAGEEPGVICVDGYSLLTERVVSDRETWMGESCGIYHPNEEIDRLLRDCVLDRLGR